jgi:hypothetical protein
LGLDQFLQNCGVSIVGGEESNDGTAREIACRGQLKSQAARSSSGRGGALLASRKYQDGQAIVAKTLRLSRALVPEADHADRGALEKGGVGVRLAKDFDHAGLGSDYFPPSALTSSSYLLAAAAAFS